MKLTALFSSAGIFCDENANAVLIERSFILKIRDFFHLCFLYLIGLFLKFYFFTFEHDKNY